MRVRLGYVAISNKLGKKVTSSSSITFTNYNKLLTEKAKFEKLRSVTASNLKDLITLLKYNQEHHIHFYRLTSALIPLVTHPEVGYWGHRELFKKDFQYIGKLIKEWDMRVDLHPDQFNVINSINPEVVANTTQSLMRQEQVLEDMEYKEGKMVIHIGGATGGKEEGIKRFIHNYQALPQSIKNRLIIENDDKSYTAKETLRLCQVLGVPMVLDVHHHNCNPGGERIEDLLGAIFETWRQETLPPKIHFSSPQNGAQDRKHADFINPEDFVTFIEKAKVINKDFDVMLECKEKDMALYQLVREIKKIKPDYVWRDESTFYTS